MTSTEYKQKVRSMESLLEMIKGNTPKGDVGKLRKKWMEKLEDIACGRMY